MAVRELAAKHAVKRISPFLGKMSDKDLERLLWMSARLSPTESTRSLCRSLDRMCQEQHSTIEVLRRAIREMAPHVRERLGTNLLVNQYMLGDLTRQQLRNEGLAAPDAYLISPTMRCNLHCPGCYAANYSQKDDLELDVIDRVLTEGKELGMYWVTVLGGEPFVRHDMWEMYRQHNDVFFQVFTNGTLIDEEATKKLADVGNVLVIFSIEGLEEQTDARRGAGDFQMIMQGMDRLRLAGVPFGFSTMVTRHNVDTVISDEFNDMLIEKGCLVGWHFLYIPVGRDPDTTLMPTAEQRELMRRRGAQHIRNEKPIFIVDFWNDAPYVGGCIAGGRHYFHINARGDVEPCIFVHMATDSIREKPLKDVLNSPYFTGIRAHQPYGDNLLRPCMILDHPHVLRGLEAEFHPFSTDGPLCGLTTTVASDLDRYSEDAARVLDPVWEQEFASKRQPDAVHTATLQESPE